MDMQTATTVATLVAEIEGNTAALNAVNKATADQAILTGADMTGEPHFDLSMLQLSAAESAVVGNALVGVLNTRLAALSAQLAAIS